MKHLKTLIMALVLCTFGFSNPLFAQFAHINIGIEYITLENPFPNEMYSTNLTITNGFQSTPETGNTITVSVFWSNNSNQLLEGVLGSSVHQFETVVSIPNLSGFVSQVQTYSLWSFTYIPLVDERDGLYFRVVEDILDVNGNIVETYLSNVMTWRNPTEDISTSVGENGSEIFGSPYPNPTEDTFTIPNFKNGNVEAISLHGRSSSILYPSGNNTFSVEGLSSGIYLLRKQSDGQSVGRIVVK